MSSNSSDDQGDSRKGENQVEDMEVDAPQPTELGKRQPKKKIAQPLANSKGAGGKKRKRQTEQEVTATDEYEAAKPYHIAIPRDLRVLLNKDWRMFLDGNLMVLPAIPSLSKIASDFFERNPELDEKSKAVVADLFTLFEQELGRALIYREERFQYKSIMEQAAQKGLKLADFYGGAHFLRLFVKLPVLISHCAEKPRDSDVADILAASTQILKFLETHQNIFFAEKYEPATVPQ